MGAVVTLQAAKGNFCVSAIPNLYWLGRLSHSLVNLEQPSCDALQQDTLSSVEFPRKTCRLIILQAWIVHSPRKSIPKSHLYTCSANNFGCQSHTQSSQHTHHANPLWRFWQTGIWGRKASESCHLRLIRATLASLVQGQEDRLHASGREAGKENGEFWSLQGELGML